ncbi:DUF6114 domain-containing protein [Streptomyces sp. 71268]|uniref:DUF6114 domain-containing protein n=1 Tax=Streptomyces sp. 71268 TaxID=3002640 RepID=UPI0023F8352E|nr:DUF6114 domain-containing protein [Streptomyces sp. 71268]WEV29063.1 DUF6114 domain-containing protein [Streptomyces sp. 71268]
MTGSRARWRAALQGLPLPRQRAAFRGWRRTRPFWAGLLLVLGGLELMAIPLSPLTVLVSLGLGGIAAIGIGIALVVAGLFLWFAPRARHYVSINALLLSVLSFAATNLGGFLIGMVLGIVGSAMGFGWTPREEPEAPAGPPPGPPSGHTAGPAPGDAAAPGPPYGGPGAEPDVPADGTPAEGAGSPGAAKNARSPRSPGGAGDGAAGAAGSGTAGAKRAEGAGADPAGAPGSARRPSGGRALRALAPLVPAVALLAAVGVPARGAPLPGDAGPPPRAATGVAPAEAGTGPPGTAGTRSPRELTAALAPALRQGPVASVPQAAPTPGPGERASAADGPGFPVAATPPTITTTRFTPHGFIVTGVTELPTARGPLRVMVLKMRAASLTDYRMRTRDGSPELDLAADSLELSGHVTLYLSRFKGCVEGLLCLTFTPDRLPVPPLVPPLVFLTDVEADQALVTADSITTDGLTLTPRA